MVDPVFQIHPNGSFDAFAFYERCVMGKALVSLLLVLSITSRSIAGLSETRPSTSPSSADEEYASATSKLEEAKSALAGAKELLKSTKAKTIDDLTKQQNYRNTAAEIERLTAALAESHRDDSGTPESRLAMANQLGKLKEAISRMEADSISNSASVESAQAKVDGSQKEISLRTKDVRAAMDRQIAEDAQKNMELAEKTSSQPAPDYGSRDPKTFTAEELLSLANWLAPNLVRTIESAYPRSQNLVVLKVEERWTLVGTDVQKTDSLIDPVVAIIKIRHITDMMSTNSVPYYSALDSLLTLKLAPLPRRKWRVVQATKEVDFDQENDPSVPSKVGQTSDCTDEFQALFDRAEK